MLAAAIALCVAVTCRAHGSLLTQPSTGELNSGSDGDFGVRFGVPTETAARWTQTGDW
jgi:hypothetical protein